MATLAASTVACVHSDVSRTGRMRLGGGVEGRAPVLEGVPVNYQEVAVLSIYASAFDTQERRTTHLLRRAKLLNCDAVSQLQHDSDQSTATCLRYQGPKRVEVAKQVIDAPASLLDRADRAGAEGAVLLKVLSQVDSRQGQARAWPLRWFLKEYPNSQFRTDVEALFVAPGTMVAASSGPITVRSAPTAK